MFYLGVYEYALNIVFKHNSSIGIIQRRSWEKTEGVRQNEMLTVSAKNDVRVPHMPRVQQTGGRQVGYPVSGLTPNLFEQAIVG